MQKDFPTRVTQDYVITRALDLLEGKKNEWRRNDIWRTNNSR
jgi:hypothetical protein